MQVHGSWFSNYPMIAFLYNSMFYSNCCRAKCGGATVFTVTTDFSPAGRE